MQICGQLDRAGKARLQWCADMANTLAEVDFLAMRARRQRAMQARYRIDQGLDPIERELHRCTCRVRPSLAKLGLSKANIATQHGEVVRNPVISLARQVAGGARESIGLRQR